MWAVRMSYNSHSSHFFISQAAIEDIFLRFCCIPPVFRRHAEFIKLFSVSLFIDPWGDEMDRAKTVDNIHFHVTSPATQIYLRVYFRQPWAVFNCYLKRCDKVGLSTQIFSNLENQVPSWFDFSPGALNFLWYLLEPITWAPGTSRRVLIWNRALIRDRALIFEKQQNVQKKALMSI